MHVEEGWHGFDSHSFKSSSQVGPVNPAGQTQSKPPFLLTHFPSNPHGLAPVLHKSTCKSHMFPVHPASQIHGVFGKKFKISIK